MFGFAAAGCFLVTVFLNLGGGGLGGESLVGALGFALFASCFVSGLKVKHSLQEQY